MTRRAARSSARRSRSASPRRFCGGVGRVAAEPDAPSAARARRGGLVRNLQLGVGKSVIVDLPEEAAEIYVGDPRIANAIVRTARRIYVSAIANGQTTIFALAGDGRKIAIIEVSVGRDVGELERLLDAAMPGNDIHVRTVANSIILTGTVASAVEAQKAIDIANGFVNDDAAAASVLDLGRGPGVSAAPDERDGRQGHQLARPSAASTR